MGTIAIFGAGGHGKVVLDLVLKIGGHEVIGFFDDDINLKGKMIGDYEILGTFDDIMSMSDRITDVVVALGNNELRMELTEKAASHGFGTPSLVHPSAVIGYKVEIGKAVQIMARCVVNPFATIGKGSIINTGASVDHDDRIGNYCHILPGAHIGGTVTVGDLSYVGMGSSLIENTTIGKNVMIAAGTVVIEDVPDNVLVAGVPAKVKKKR